MHNRHFAFFCCGLVAGLALKGLWDAQAGGARVPPPRRNIRPAGPQEMENPPRNWDIVDEQGDESFPASDPPANY